jgi:hypothetical protein
VRQANVPGGRPHKHVVKLSEREHDELRQRADAAGVSIPRLLVESALSTDGTVSDRAHTALRLLELDDRIRRIGADLNQLTRAADQDSEIAAGTQAALRAVVRACLSVDATARWVMGMTAAVSEISIDAAVDLAVDEKWSAVDTGA